MKKKLNIPTCDVIEDPDYENIVSATFVRPQGHLRHVKQLGNGEPDLFLDYVIDQDDLVSSMFDTVVYTMMYVALVFIHMCCFKAYCCYVSE